MGKYGCNGNETCIYERGMKAAGTEYKQKSKEGSSKKFEKDNKEIGKLKEALRKKQATGPEHNQTREATTKLEQQAAQKAAEATTKIHSKLVQANKSVEELRKKRNEHAAKEQEATIKSNSSKAAREKA